MAEIFEKEDILDYLAFNKISLQVYKGDQKKSVNIVKALFSELQMQAVRISPANIFTGTHKRCPQSLSLLLSDLLSLKSQLFLLHNLKKKKEEEEEEETGQFPLREWKK